MLTSPVVAIPQPLTFYSLSNQLYVCPVYPGVILSPLQTLRAPSSQVSPGPSNHILWEACPSTLPPAVTGAEATSALEIVYI